MDVQQNELLRHCSVAKKDKILYIINGMTKNEGVVSVSGGDMRLLEILRNNRRFESYILTTQNGKDFIDRYPDATYKKAYLIGHDMQSGVISNLNAARKSFFFRKSGVRAFKNGIVYSSCEHLYDVLPALRLKWFNGCRWYAVYHWVEDYPWREKRGGTPLIQRYTYWLNRWFSGLLIKHFSDKILAVSDQTRDKLISLKKVSPTKIKPVYCGVNYSQVASIAKKYAKEKGSKYDAVFMKRLNYGKGVLDLLKIWKGVVKKHPTASLAIIGDGTPDVLAKINDYIKRNSLENNISLLGVIYDVEEKFRVLNSAKLFLLPTREENWAIVVGEAMAVGIPVVVSRLKEIEPIWKDNVYWCDPGNIEAFVSCVDTILKNPEQAQRMAAKASEFIPRYDWERIARDELEDN